MAKRIHISLKTKLAAALLQLRDPQGDPYIDFEHAQKMSAEQIISLFVWDHYPIPHAMDGPDEPWNLQPIMIAPHKKKTAQIDVPQIAKTKRISRKQEEFRRRLLEKDRPPNADFSTEPLRGQRWPKRKMRTH